MQEFEIKEVNGKAQVHQCYDWLGYPTPAFEADSVEEAQIWVNKEIELHKLQSTFSDYHKDLMGFRPRFGSAEQWKEEEWLRTQMKALDAHFESLKSTPKGREQLIKEGWVL